MSRLAELLEEQRQRQMTHTQGYGQSLNPNDAFSNTSEAFAHGIYNAPGNLARLIESMPDFQREQGYYSDPIDEFTGADLLNQEFTPETPWQNAISFAGEALADPFNLVGLPYAAYKAPGVIHKGLNAYADLIDDTPGLFGEAGSVSNFINDYITSAKARGVNPKTEIVDDLFQYSDLPEAQQLAIDRIKSGDYQVPLGLTGKGRSQRGSIGDLPMDEASRMQRAKDMGFDTDTVVYHGNGADLEAFKLPEDGKTGGTGVYLTDNTDVANSYTKGLMDGGANYPVYLQKDDYVNVYPKNTGANWNDIETNNLYIEHPDGTGDDALSLFPDDLDANSVTTTDQLAYLLRDAGYKGAIINDVKDIGPNTQIYTKANEYLFDKGYKYPSPIGDPRVPQELRDEAIDFAQKFEPGSSNVYVSFDPTKIRSINAKFDPAKADSANLLDSRLLPIPASLIGLNYLKDYEDSL